MNLFSSAKAKFAMPSLSGEAVRDSFVGCETLEGNQRERDVVVPSCGIQSR